MLLLLFLKIYNECYLSNNNTAVLDRQSSTVNKDLILK